MAAVDYKAAGVDLETYAESMRRIPALIRRTQSSRAMPLAGGFAGLFQLHGEGRRYDDPVLVSGTDGVGTKIKVAIEAGRFDTLGIDLVAMCVNDCLCLGAEPLFFLDYLAMNHDNPDLVEQLVQGVSDGCLQAGAALVGGETAVMPDLYADGDFDMAGFCVGVVEKSKIIDGSRIRPGDVVLGVPSSGFHSNGYSLIRRVVFDHAGLSVSARIDELNATVGEVLLRPTRIYAGLVDALLADAQVGPAVTGIAHITGGGLIENTRRVVPDGCKLLVDLAQVVSPAEFGWLQKLGGIDTEEMFRVFNMGVGLSVIIRADQATSAQALIEKSAGAVMTLGRIDAE